MLRLHAVVHGRVQGVGFRYFVTRVARELRLSGRVRNRPDGALEVEAEGERDGLTELVEAIRRGPPAARVERLEESWSEGPPRLQGFVVE